MHAAHTALTYIQQEENLDIPALTCAACRLQELEVALTAQLKEQYTPDTVRDMLAGRGLPTGGTPAALYQRLAGFLAAQQMPGAAAAAQPPAETVSLQQQQQPAAAAGVGPDESEWLLADQQQAFKEELMEIAADIPREELLAYLAEEKVEVDPDAPLVREGRGEEGR
jgi:hypothetical protein